MKKLICLLLALLVPAAALADTLSLPSGMRAIESQAFSGDTSITSVVLPSGAESIGDKAFLGCSSLQDIYIPASVTSIGTNALQGCAPGLLVRTAAGSAAMDYAARNLIDYQAGTTYRALLIAQSSYESYRDLNAPPNDVYALTQALTCHPTTPYSCETRYDLTALGMANAINSVFGKAKAQDVSLLYYSGHGASGGLLVGVDSSTLPPSSLRVLLDNIPGRKIVIVDACHSGGIIGRSAQSAMDDFSTPFLSAFTTQSRTNLATDSYYVITAAHSSQECVEMGTSVDGGYTWFYYGLFTRHLCEGLGWDYLGRQYSLLMADANGDGSVSIQEAYTYARTNAAAANSGQTAQVYPANCSYQSVVRD